MVFGKKKKEDDVKPKDKPNPTFNISSYSLPAKDDIEGFTAEDIRLIIDEWLKETHVKYKTRYTKRQVWAVTKLQSIADKYDIKCLKEVLTEFRINKLSEEGKSSEELVNILRERLSTFMEEKTSGSGLGRFFE